MGHHFHRSTGPLGPVDGLHVIRAAGNRAEPLIGNDDEFLVHGRRGKSALHCRDGFSVSVIAGPRYYHCWPRPGLSQAVIVHGEIVEVECPVEYRGPYFAFEVGYPSAVPEPWDQWREYASDPGDWTFVYSYVPYAMVRALVELHGGLARMGNGVERQPPPERFTCPACGCSTPHPDDVVQRYCPGCHWYTGVPELAAERPELFTRYSRRPPEQPPGT